MRESIESAIECLIARKYDEALAHLQATRAASADTKASRLHVLEAMNPDGDFAIAYPFDWECQLREARVHVAELIAAARNHMNVIGCGTALDCDCCNRLRDAIASVEGEP
jgi:hypothetical protein